MNLLHCKHCDSNLVNLIAVKIQHDEYAERNVSIRKNYLSMKEPQATKLYLRCFNCAKMSETLVKNCKGCCSIETSKYGEDQTQPRNEIIDGGRFN
jgi:hypothetical protein